MNVYSPCPLLPSTMPYKIGYAILLDDASHNYARGMELDISQRFQTRGGLRQSPHVTIKPPFTVETLEPFIEYFDQLAQTTEPFDIELNGIDFFEPKVIFLNVEKNQKLHTLHQRIISDLKANHSIDFNPKTEGENVRFHSSLAVSDLTEENFYKAKEYLKDEKPRFTFRATTLGLFFYLGPEEGWIIYRRAKLGS